MKQIAVVMVSLAAAAMPLAEKYWFRVLPISARVRDDVLPVAILASIAAIAAGVATARHTEEGLSVGWLSLAAFLATTIGLYAAIDLMPRAASGLYVIFFASFTLSVASFLSTHGSAR